MSIQIINGDLYQYDTGRQIRTDMACDSLEFYRLGDCHTTKVVPADGVAVIPDEILTKSGELRVYAIITGSNGNRQTIENHSLTVKPRPRVSESY